ncbi:hypothetical protein [Candidatus Infernicultor aquiphilus]
MTEEEIKAEIRKRHPLKTMKQKTQEALRFIESFNPKRRKK